MKKGDDKGGERRGESILSFYSYSSNFINYQFYTHILEHLN